jgi:hypothetical protein
MQSRRGVHLKSHHKSESVMFSEEGARLANTLFEQQFAPKSSVLGRNHPAVG